MNTDTSKPTEGQANNRKMTRHRQIGTILLVLQLILAAASLLVRTLASLNLIAGIIPAGRTISGVSMAFALALTVTDLIWLIFYLRCKLPKTLARIHVIVAWLIYHTATLPFILLADRAEKIGVKSYSMILAALLVMGMIPILTIAWIDWLAVHKFRN